MSWPLNSTYHCDLRSGWPVSSPYSDRDGATQRTLPGGTHHARTLRQHDSVLREGYTLISSRCDQFDADVFRTRLGLRPVICMRGTDAARMFYESGRVTRAGAVPSTTQHLLQDEGSVQSLEGEDHARRKRMFLSTLGSDHQECLTSIFRQKWAANWARVEPGQAVPLQDFATSVLTRTACRFADVAIDRDLFPRLAHNLRAVVDRAGSFGPVGWAARWQRRGTEWRAEGTIDHARCVGYEPAAGTVMRELIDATDGDGRSISNAVAAVELINVLRPIVAVARFIVFASSPWCATPSGANS